MDLRGSTRSERMMNITVRNIPEDIIERIRTLSKIEKRSLNNEILMILERGVEKEFDHFISTERRITKETQIDIWKTLANQWEDDRSTTEIIEDIYQHRTSSSI